MLMIIFLFTIYGCKEDTVTSTSTDNLDLSIMSSDQTDNLSGILIIDTAKILIKDIKLNVANTSDETNFKTGPFIFYLNTFLPINTVTTAQIPEGTYDKIIFKIHKPDPNEYISDLDFTTGGRYSVVVKGFYNGNYFVFKSDLTANQKLSFPNHLILTNLGKTNVTIFAKPYLWFWDNGTFLDPTVPSNLNNIEHMIKDNVNVNIRAFKDANKDGQPD